MPDFQQLLAFTGFMGLDHGVCWALDAALYPEGAQQVAHQRGFAGAQVALQLNVGVAHLGQLGQSGGESLGGGLIRPKQYACRHGGARFGFYNSGVQISSNQLVSRIQAWALELGFSQIGVAGVDLSSAEPGLLSWLEAGFHGGMAYMQTHGLKRARPAELVPGTVSVLTVRMDYLPAATAQDWTTVEAARLERPTEGIVSLYARGRDYHKVLRGRLQKLCDRIAAEVGPLGHRVFTDSAPVLEAELASRSGQGWRGKHTLVLSREGGSMFFLGEIYLDIALPPTDPVSSHCGQCDACVQACPTQAIVAPYRLDARRCISYLTIESPDPIPLEMRPQIGNRIYGCDDCQLVCPWNKFARRQALPDFDERPGMSGESLVRLLAWTEAEFLRRTEGSPVRRIGHERWLRNTAVAAGNALALLAQGAEAQALRDALLRWQDHPSGLVREHVQWALAQTRGGR